MDSIITEGTKETPSGRIHSAEPGGYGRKDDEDSEGKKVEPAVKRGRGRPKKGADSDTGEVKKFDFAKDLQGFMVGNLPGGKAPGKKGQVHKIKDEGIEESQGVAEGTELTPGDHALVNHPDKRHIFHGKRVKVGNKNSDGTYHVSTNWNEVGANLPADTLSKLQKQLNLKFPKQGVAEGFSYQDIPMKVSDLYYAVYDKYKRSPGVRKQKAYDAVEKKYGPEMLAMLQSVHQRWDETIARQGISRPAKRTKDKEQGVAEGKYDPAKDTFNPETHTAITKNGVDKIIPKSQLAKYKEQGWKERHSLKAFHKNREKQDMAEDTKETPTGRVHKAEPGGYGRKDDEDSEGKKVQAQVKRGRGRPKKNADSDTGEVKNWDTDKLASWIVGNKPKTLPGKASVKHKLKDWMEHVESTMLVESIVGEGRMGEVDMIIQDIVNGNSDLYDVMNHPRDPQQEYASKLLQRKYEEVARDNGLHPDDDFEEIESIMMDQLENEYGTGITEVALDPSQVAIAAVKAPGQTTQQPGTQQQGTQQTTQQTSQQANKPGMGATVIDFKNPNDPLKAALDQAVKNKQVTALGEAEVMEKAPPGMEDVVLALKKKFPGQEGRAYAIAWDQYNKKNGKKSVTEGKNAERLKDILSDYPHEHSLAQEGWGMHESLYQTLCDHYWKEGRIPRDVMYGPSETLRKHVEECYTEDTQPVMGEGLVGAALGGVAGAALGKSPTAASIGANIGSELQDTLTTEGDREDAEMQISTPAFLRKARGADPLSLSQVGTTDRYRVGDKTYSIGDEILARGTAATTGQDLEELPESELEASLRGSVQDMEEDYMNESKLNEKYMGFKKTVAAIKKGGSAEDPEAVAASIGRKKYGKEKFQKAAAAGKKLGEQSVAKDIQMESWESQLNSLLNEGMTITTSTGNEGASDSVSISATDADAQSLMKLLQNSGLMKGQSSSMSTMPDDHADANVAVEPVSADEVMSTLEPEDDRGDGALGFLKRMLGARGQYSDVASSDDYEQEGDDCEEVEEMHNQTASSGDSHMSPVPEEEEMEEGNAFGKAVSDAKKDGIQKGETVSVGGKKYPVKEEDEDLEESALDQPATMEAEETCNECGMNESECGGHNDEEKLDEWANSPNDSDEQFLADMTYMTKTISGGLNNMKQDQTVVPSARVKTETERKTADMSMAEMLRKLQNIN